jgi:putative aminopeptidase FrvX
MITGRRVIAALSLWLLVSAGSATGAVTGPGSLQRLIAAQGVSGFESDVRDVIRDMLPRWASPRVDEVGNLIVTIGQGAPHLLVATSIDEDGYLVSDVTGDGYLRLTRVSSGATYRLFDQFVYGQPILIGAHGREVPGVVATASTHLQRGRDASTAVKGLDDLWVDVGATTRADVDRLGVRLLDTVALRDRRVDIAGSRVAGVAAQARANAVAMINLLAGMDRAPKVTGTITLAWTAQGLFGDRGTARLAQEIQPDRVILISRAALGRDADARGAFGRLGGGPIIEAGATALLDRARQAGITVQTVPALRGTNAWPASKVQAVALPVLFAQTPVETVQDDDVRHLAALLHAETGLPEGRPERLLAIDGHVLRNDILRRLEPLVDAYGVSGHEAAVRDAVAKQLPKWAKPETDAKGNLTVSFGQGGKEILFVAHTDELGYEIVNLQEDGTATVRKRGGFFDSLLEAHPVLVHTSRGRVPAIVAPRPNYMRAAETQPKPEEVLLYFGTNSRQDTEALGVAKGDAATVEKTFTRLANGRATARSIDDRAGCAALLMALEKIDPAKVTNRITFAWVVEEETGLAGSAALAGRLHPAYAFAVDTFVSSDSPVDPQRMAHIPLGTGAVLRAVDNSSITPPDTVAKIRALAAAHEIPTTVGVTSGGNDGSSFSRYGSIVVPISWPGRYSHSAVEVIDGADLAALANLIVALVNEFPVRQ